MILRYVANFAPTANAGQPQNVPAFTTVTLDGSGSTDPEDNITGYNWTQFAGTSVVLSGANTPTPSFTAPQPTGSSETLSFRLTVTDAFGLTNTSDVTITVTALPGQPAPGTGGTVNEFADPDGARIWRAHTFFGVGALTLPNPTDVEYLIVGGGGGGGGITNVNAAGAGGGGGGGLREGTRSVAAGTLTIRVGTGGVGASCGTACSAGANGGNSEFDGVIAVGGGRGGYLGNSSGAAGGSGGGGRLNAQGIGGAGTSGQGNAGGSGSGDDSFNLAGAGGGGAGTAGQSVTSNTGGDGGAGRSSGIDNTTRFYSGGGAGGGYGTAGGSGGIGGGGGSPAARGPGQPAQANTGGGGGGATGSIEGGAFNGGNGGSGIVVVRYVINTGPTADAGDSATAFAGQPFERLGIVTDPDNNVDENSISWVQTSGTSVDLESNADPHVLRFTSTQPANGAASETLTFQLTATDAFGLSSTDTVTITLQAIAELTATKTAKVFSEDGSDCADLSASAPTEPQNPAAIPGACIAYLVSVENTGPVAAQGINLIDALPASLTLRGAALTSGWGTETTLDFTPDCTGADCTVEITSGVINADTTATLTIRATIN
ncbi:glycine-rich domain-containing protein [Roseinatronobacter monicus]|uniref:PKD domain-containing protein n=1 Tax=Roseinatronobacter monicus TaxID=393481 RepID=UPI0014773084|nr:DUF11 domain-containing protein [Roseinatronobacter monicus]